MSHLGWKITFAIAEPIVACIRNGRSLPVCLGAFAGACAGAAGGLITIYLLAPLVLLGAVAGAAVAGALFKRPEILVAADSSGKNTGSIRNFWFYNDDEINLHTIVVLLENAIYTASDDKDSVGRTP